MRKKNTASPSRKNNTAKILTILAILLLLGFAFWSIKWSAELSDISDKDVAAVTLWSWSGNFYNIKSLTNIFEKTTDLEIKILAIGIINKEGKFVESEVLHKNFTGALRIEVKNKGKKTSTEWHFEIKLPTTPSFTYISNSLSPLKKNEKKTFLLTFDKVANEKEGIIEAKIISESKEKNTKNNSTRFVVSIVE